MNKLNTKKTHLSGENNSKFEPKEKNNVPNIYKNISTTKNKNQKEIIIISKTNNKSSINSEIDCLNEKKIEKDKDKNFKKNIINKKISAEETQEEDKLFEKLYDEITGYNIEEKIKYKNLKKFFFNKIPENKTLSTNINIRNKEFKNKNNSIKNLEKLNRVENIDQLDLIENIKTYDFDLEILRNNQIYYFGKIISYLPYMIIKIYISDNFTKYGEINQQRVEESDFFCVGKIESNMLRNEFNVYKGNDKIKYQKILKINYNINLFGLFGIRVMNVNKYDNNQLLITYKNEVPKWDNEFKFYKLNFNGRVKMICKKNFILKKDEENIFQCGKIDDNSFALDFIYPLSPFESFSISITSLVNKIACE